MSATDELLVTGYPNSLRPELHKALKARGIDYWIAQGLTIWSCPDGRECVAYGYQSNGKPVLAVKIVGITDPEQVIAATLGAGTLTAEQVREAWCGHLRRDCLYDPPTPDWQAIADELNATLGDACAVPMSDGMKVYLVEVSDELLESWFPFAVFLHRESAEDYAEALRSKDDGVLCFARVSELKVVDA